MPSATAALFTVIKGAATSIEKPYAMRRLVVIYRDLSMKRMSRIFHMLQRVASICED